jgi:hypothetical protein
MATQRELQILAAGALAEVGQLTPEEREAQLRSAFYEGQEAEPAGFLGLDFDRWRKDAEISLHKGVCSSDAALQALLRAAGASEVDAVKYLTGLAVALRLCRSY